MLGAGVPIVQTLQILAKQLENKMLSTAVGDVAERIEGGASLAESMRIHDTIFDKIFVNLVAAGEVSGSLDKVLTRLAVHYEKSSSMNRKVKSAMMYPTSVLVIIVLVVLAIVPSLGSIITLVLFGFYVVAIYRAYKGDTWKMPLIGGFAAKWSGNIISVNPQKNSHVWKGLLIWAAVIAFFIWAGSLPDNKSASIPKSKEDTLLEEIVSMPEFKAKTRGMDLENNEEQASTVFNELLQDGLKRIDDQTALTRIRILSKALKIADVNTCAALARDEEAGFSDLLEKLDQSLQNQWLDTGYMAVKASLKQYPINNIDESTVEEANKILFSGLTSGESERFSGFDKDTVNLSDADTCWFIQTYYGHILTLDEPYRSSLIHSLGK